MRAVRAAMDDMTAAAHGRRARVGFVPTMGALHDGHASLFTAARSPTAMPDFVVASIFVNPTQFAPHEDLASYPRPADSDAALLRAHGVDVLFQPTARAMYPSETPFRSFIDPAGADDATPEGIARPGFFRGVATVVTKLLSIVEPTAAVFGAKDAVQCIIVRALVRDLNLRPRIIIAPTVREADGLAMSSRNAYLSPEERSAAPAMYASLRAALRELRETPEGRAYADAEARARRARLTEIAAAATAAGAADDRAAEVAAQAAATQSRTRAAAAAAAAADGGTALDPMLQRIRRIVEDRINNAVRVGTPRVHAA